MDYEHRIDPHLNLFRRYGLAPTSQEYENNVTQAFINALRLSDPRVTRVTLAELVPEIATFSVDWSDIAFSLQRPPERSPGLFQYRAMLAISRDGRPPTANERQDVPFAAANPDGDGDGETDGEASEGVGRPDGWIYTKTTPTLCVSIEAKVRGTVDLRQIRRHERTYSEAGVSLERLDLRWADLSRAVDRAYWQHPNPVLDEFLSFLAGEALSATLRFDAPTVRRADQVLPQDVMEDLRQRLREELGLSAAELTSSKPHVLTVRNFEALGNIEVRLEGSPPEVDVVTELSFGTARAGPEANRVSMPDQIARLVENLVKEEGSRRFIEAARATGRPLSWTILDRLQWAQSINWDPRNSDDIATILREAGRPVDAEVCFGADQRIPLEQLDRVQRGLRSLHRAGVIGSGNFKGYRVFARAYLGDLRVPAYERRPVEVLPQVTEHCIRWYRILRILSGAD